MCAQPVKMTPWASDDTSDEKGGPVPGSSRTTSGGVTVTFRDVNVEVNGLGEDYQTTCASALTSLVPGLNEKSSKRLILRDIHGQVRPGEMLLVLGRPGSGCTSLLKILSNQLDEFENVDGTLRFNDLSPRQAKAIREKIVMNTEDDRHWATLTVAQTVRFATSLKLLSRNNRVLESSKEMISQITGSILSSLRISHAQNTIVGGDFVRGVSGGERKRVSIAEVMATQAPLICWDNSTRGLDSHNACELAAVWRRSASEEDKTIVATLYQASNAIYEQFDKVLVLAEGRQIFYGPVAMAKRYFEEMGFECQPGANVSDFLTSVTVDTERRVRLGFEGKVPTSVEEFESRYKGSDVYQKMTEEMKGPQCLMSDRDSTTAPPSEKDSESPPAKHGTIQSLNRRLLVFLCQVWICCKRQAQIVYGDWKSNLLQICASIVIALVTGSLYFDTPANSSALFAKTGALCYPVLYFAMTRLSETTASFNGRHIVSRQKRLALVRPGAYALALALTDIPIITAVFSLFHVIYYFMVGFQMAADKFFIAYLILVIFTLSFSGLFRMVGSWCRHSGVAFQVNGTLSTIFLVYIGYMIPLPNIPVWFRWMAWINPAVYAYNAIMANEMSDRTLECVEPQLIPFGPGYTDDSLRSCTVIGSENGTMINGETYIDTTYWAGKRWMWPNLGILFGFWIFYTIMTAIGFEVNLHQEFGSKILFNRQAQKQYIAKKGDLEHAESSPARDESATIVSEPTTFTFKNINYHVRHGGKELQLLRDVSGFVKQGQLTALMGSSGAGKTTLMDVLAQRKDTGRLDGSIMINGKPQGISFQRTTGYCEQNDVHEPTATVLESLMFSARLRQDYNVPDEEKLDYVHRIMDLLELTPLQHAIVGNPSSGLSIEQRKRLTLATELVAKPSLLFLDEPTSGLDGQSAYEVCRFMRKLAAAGQTIICTIHQPSASLFETFDALLLLAKGGRTVYFGPTGENSQVVLDYFSQRGAPCAPDANPAEHIVEVVQGAAGGNTNWGKQWEESKEREDMMREIDSLNAAPYPSQPTETSTPDEPQARKLAFATPLLYQVYLVTKRQSMALWRNPDYVWNKLLLHLCNGLFGGFTFWRLGNGTFDMQLYLMAVFNFITIAPGCINQLQPLFLQNRDIFEAREKKSKTYHWFAFVAAQLFAETPLLIICGTLVFGCWYFAVGFPSTASISGQVYVEMLLYEGLFTSIGQAIAACSPNAYFSALANPIIIGAILINFSGVVVPYSQIKAFWRYWLYYLNPFTYLMQGLLQPVVWDLDIECTPSELTNVPLPSSMSCGEYMADFLRENSGYVVDPEATVSCEYCPYKKGADYLRTININGPDYGWRGVGITALFCVSSYALVFLMMKIRTKATKKTS